MEILNRASKAKIGEFSSAYYATNYGRTANVVFLSIPNHLRNPVKKNHLRNPCITSFSLLHFVTSSGPLLGTLENQD